MVKIARLVFEISTSKEYVCLESKLNFQLFKLLINLKLKRKHQSNDEKTTHVPLRKLWSTLRIMTLTFQKGTQTQVTKACYDPQAVSLFLLQSIKGFLTAGDRWNHKHQKAINGGFLCDLCTKQLSSMQKMNRHVKKCKKMIGNNLFKKTEKNQERNKM